MYNRTFSYSFLLLLTLFSACTDQAKEALRPSYAQVQLPQEEFNINASEDHVLESKYGSLLSIPQGAFIDENGEVWTGAVNLALTELHSPLEMAKYHITSSNDDGLLKNHGIVQLTASTPEGNPLTFHEINGPYMEVATGETSGKVQVYEGVKDKYGAITWKNPTPTTSYLTPLDFDVLDFYPEGFEQTVEQSMPFKSYATASKHLKDSLFYALHQYLVSPDSSASGINGSHKNPFHAKFIKQDPTHDAAIPIPCQGIDPAAIKTIKNKRFSTTFLATRAFSERLKQLYATCNNELLELYIHNLDKNLWEVDQLVAKQLGEEHKMYPIFQNFANERLTNVKEGSKHAALLKRYYNQKLKANQASLEKAQKSYQDELAKQSKKYQKALNKENKALEKLQKNYNNLLRNRLKYRMKRHGIKVKNRTLHSLAEKLAQMAKNKELDTFELDVTVEKQDQFDRVHVYVVDPVEKTLFALLPDNNGIYNQSYRADWALILWKSQLAHIVVMAYKGDQKFTASQEFQLQKKNSITISTESTTEKAYQALINKFDRQRKRFNKLAVDLKFQADIYQHQQKQQQLLNKERKRQERLAQERLLMLKLAMKTFPCCFGKEFLNKGKSLFENNCTQCHAINEQVVGPALRYSLRKHSLPWLIKFTQYPKEVIKSGDPYARKLYSKYKQVMPNHDFLSKNDILAIYLYIEKMSD